ncbi:MAG: EscU/YscU/HrcU family type III secretion system export apparatus switch protein [Spirochaetes bacterium]|nr:EscU/YscU/HrcU family type III secretion system export apparatus switch protein [Spirochaetota bacterium]
MDKRMSFVCCLNEDFLEIPQDFILDIQRFASAEAEGRTEKASEHKKRKAREEGRVALSKEVPAAVITLLSFMVIYFFAQYIFRTIQETFLYVFENVTKLDFTKDHFFLDIFLIPYFKVFLPVAITAFMAAVFSNYLQIGLKMTIKSIKPDFKKVSPNVLKFLKKQVFSVTGFFNLLKSVTKIGIIGLVAYFTISGKIEELKNILFVESIFYSFIFVTKLAFSIVIKAAIILLVFSIADIIFVRWQYEESLKMKKQEVKEEFKELYGDPNVRMRLRQMYQALLSQKKMLAEVPKADVIITNPTHYAVALFYDRYIDDAPRVIAKGKDKFAQQIKEAAKSHDVFMYENVALARSLYDEVEVNELIPRAMYGLIINAYKLSMQHDEGVGAGV